jgi:transposase
MTRRDQLGTFFEDGQFVALFPRRGQPAEAPWRLALVTVMQFAENLSDRQAADAVRARIDWKYALGLELEDAGFDYSVLSQFRDRLLAGGQEQHLFEQMLVSFQQAGLLKAGGQQRSDSTHILASIRELNRLELVGEALRSALNALAAVVPTWLQAWVPADWFERYGIPITAYRLPKAQEERAAWALGVGQDGFQLLRRLYSTVEYPWLAALPAVETLRRIWVQQYLLGADQIGWRAAEDLPPVGVRIASPFDLEVRWGKKRTRKWLGYKVHLTETCHPDAPHLITQVETRPGNEIDGAATEDIHRALQARQLLPAEHLVDTAYVSAALLVSSRADYGVELVGPVLADTSWQAVEQTGYDITDGCDSSAFSIDWERQVVTCPQGHQSRPWRETTSPTGNAILQTSFYFSDCAPCSAREKCTRSRDARRPLTLHPQAEHLALQEARQRQKTQAFKEQYAARAGVEGLVSETAFVLGMRRSRYRGLAKTHFQHLATAAALNLKRAAYWLMGIPCITTRTTSFAALAPI